MWYQSYFGDKAGAKISKDVIKSQHLRICKACFIKYKVNVYLVILIIMPVGIHHQYGGAVTGSLRFHRYVLM